MQIVIDISEDRYKQVCEEQWLPNRLYFEKAIANGTPLNEVLDKIRDEIEAEMNDLYRQPSIDQRTLTIIHACQRHIAIIDKHIGKEQE